MLRYLFFRLVNILSLALPLRIGYWLALRIADLQYSLSYRDRRAVRTNLKKISRYKGEDIAPRELEFSTREVFRNFAKYLVDFFRSGLVDGDYINRYVKFRGLERLDAVLGYGRGLLLLTAHLGNWELGGLVLAQLGYKLNAVVLRHKDRRVNRLFTQNREAKGERVVPVGFAIRQCFLALKRNELVGFVADRDFFNNGIKVSFLGRRVSIPRGPAEFSLKTQAPLLLSFMIRNRDDTFSLVILDKVIFPEEAQGTLLERINLLTQMYISLLEPYIIRYKEQWYIFQPFDEPVRL